MCQCNTQKETAEYLGVSEGTLAVWASTKRYNLPYVKIGSLVKYRMSDLQEFLQNNLVEPLPNYS